MTKRIWELDAFRGLCILGVMAVHLIYDLVDLYGILQWQYPTWFYFLKQWGGTLFFLLSGVCVTLGSNSIRRGLIVFGCGLLISAVTYAMVLSGFDESTLIYFGALHCLGVCMILWWLFKRLPTWLLPLLAIPMVIYGIRLESLTLVDHIYLIFLGFTPANFFTADFFPLLPFLGWFLLGSAAGRTLYRNKQTLLPSVDPQNPLIRGLCFLGRHSLWIYLLHQPIFAGICMLLA